jgi:hypothetical protein
MSPTIRNTSMNGAFASVDLERRPLIPLSITSREYTPQFTCGVYLGSKQDTELTERLGKAQILAVVQYG